MSNLRATQRRQILITQRSFRRTQSQSVKDSRKGTLSVHTYTTRAHSDTFASQTKHFQTLFLTPEIRLVDCPGLVLPALVPMELQVLSNVLPIAQIPALPACIRYVGNMMPIEEIFGLDMSMLEPEPDNVIEDKRTWRKGMRPPNLAEAGSTGNKTWTAMQVMSAYALKRGWKTARTGWPDTMRAGNASK
jgi:ribosome biogenesis GTPase A